MRWNRVTDGMIQGGFLFLILSTPLMFGSVYPWAHSLLQLVAAFMFGAWLVRIYILGRNAAGGIPNKKILFPVFLFFSLILLQLTPLPPGILKALSPKTAEIYKTFLSDVLSGELPKDLKSFTSDVKTTEGTLPSSGEGEGIASDRPGKPSDPLSTMEVTPSPPTSISSAALQPDSLIGNRSISLSRNRTRKEALLVLAYFMLFFLLLNYKPEGSVRAFLQRIVVCIAFTGILVALIGIAQKALGISMIYGFWKPFHELRRPFMGPYVNANHFAGYIELTLPILIALFLGWSNGFKNESSSSSILETIQSQENNKIALCLTGLFIILLALFLSFSRAGIASFLLALLLIFFVLSRLERRFRPEHWAKVRRFWNVSLLVFILVFGFFTLIIFALKVGGLEGLPRAARFQLWLDTWRMFRDFPLFGIGLNCYSIISPFFDTIKSNLVFTHVENDYLQLLTETGIVGACFVFIFFFFFFKETFKIFSWRIAEFDKLASSHQTTPPSSSSSSGTKARSRRYSDTEPSRKGPTYPLPKTNYYLFWGCVCSVISLMLHSFSDFNLHIPANGLLFFLLLALIYRLARLNQPLFSFSSSRNRMGKEAHG